MTDMKGSGEALENFILPVTSFGITGLVVGEGLERHIHGGTRRPLQASQ